MTTNKLIRGLTIAATVLLTGSLVLGVSAPASASTSQQTVSWTKIGIFPRTGPSLSSSRAGAAVSDGTVVTVECEADGDPVTSDVAVDDTIWASTNIGWLPNAFLESGYDGRTPGVPDCNATAAPVAGSLDPQAVAPSAPTGSNDTANNPTPGGPADSPAPSAPEPVQPSTPVLTAAGAYGLEWTAEQIASTSSYNRVAAARWALSHFADWNGGYGEGDCTYFASTMLHSGAKWSLTDDWTTNVAWWDFGRMASKWSFGGPSKDFVDAQAFQDWIRKTGYADVSEVTDEGKAGQPLTAEAQVGDLVQYDFHDSGQQHWRPDGTVDHTMVIVGFQDGQALVVGVDDVPVDAKGNPNPNRWQNAVNPSKTMFQRYPGARAYLVHITR